MTATGAGHYRPRDPRPWRTGKMMKSAYGGTNGLLRRLGRLEASREPALTVAEELALLAPIELVRRDPPLGAAGLEEPWTPPVLGEWLDADDWEMMHVEEAR